MQAQKVVYAFINTMAKGAPFVGNASLLPYPKKTIEEAFERHIAHYQMLKELCPDAFVRLGYDKELDQIMCMFLRLDDWHDIDPEDVERVREMNSHLGEPPPWAWQLVRKYTTRAARRE